MSTPTPSSTGRPAWLIPAAVAAAVVVGAGGGVLLLSGGDGQLSAAPDPTSVTRSGTPGNATATPTPSGGLVLSAGTGQAGRCLPVSADALRRMPTAFAGTVTQVDGTAATIRVDRWWRGTATARGSADVVVQGMSPELQELVAGVDLEPGGRYLVTATEAGDVSACGFSAAYSPRLERLYAEAFGG